MSTKKTALIVVDGAKAGEIADIINSALHDCQAKLVQAQSFAGTDLLPADVFFLGCESAEPASFAYLDQMLQHINLSGRCCGVFSSDDNALNYLCTLVKACDAKLIEALLVKDPTADSDKIKKWAQDILNG